MKVIKILLLVAVLIGTCSLGAAAQDDTYRVAVEKLLLLTKQDQLVDQMFQQFQEVQMQQLQQMNVSQAQYPIVEKYLGKIYELMKTEMSWDIIKDDYIQIYMSVYTEEEIKGLVAFYESPIGQKTIEKMPLLAQQSLLIGQKYFTRLFPQIQTLGREMAAEIGPPKSGNEEPGE